MGGKSRKTGGVSKDLINRIKGKSENCGNTPKKSKKIHELISESDK